MSRVLLMGSGAIASLYGMMLQRALYHITMCCRSHYSAISSQGIEVTSSWGDAVFRPNVLINDLSGVSDSFDFIVVATKVLPESDCLKMFHGFHPSCPIILIQNGIFIEDTYRQRFPTCEIISGLAFVCVFRESPTVVRHTDYGRLDLGLFPSGESDKIDSLCRQLQSVGVDARYSLAIQRQRWEKLVWNAAFNPLSVLFQSDTLSLFTVHHLEDRIRAIMIEVCECALRDGVVLDDDIIDLKMTQTRAMVPYKTSMLLDYENNRPLEIEPILGHLIRFSRSKELACPELNRLYGALCDCVSFKKELL